MLKNGVGRAEPWARLIDDHDARSNSARKSRWIWQADVQSAKCWNTCAWWRQSNKVLTSLIGQGTRHGEPPPADPARNILKTHAIGTPPTTPYQPEISQGRLEALLNFPDEHSAI